MSLSFCVEQCHYSAEVCLCSAVWTWTWSLPVIHTTRLLPDNDISAEVASQYGQKIPALVWSDLVWSWIVMA